MSESSSAPDPSEPLGQEIRSLWVAAYREFQWKQRGLRITYGDKPIPRWDGGVAADGSEKKPIWTLVAEFVLAHSLNPRVLIHAVFTDCKEKPPTPVMLMGKFALERYRTHRKWFDEDRKMELESELTRLSTRIFFWHRLNGLSEEVAGRCTLASSQESLSPLFRYCFARKFGWSDIADEYRDRALEQYLLDQEGYDRIWQDLIPDELKHLAWATPSA